MIEEKQLLELQKKHGTPLYVYDSNKIIKQYNRLKDSFNIPIKINYACKALSNINILTLMKNLGAGLDAVSLEEVQLGLKAGFKPEDIVYTPNSTNFKDFEEAIKIGVLITIDDLQNLEEFGKKYGPKKPMMIRINPHILAGGNYKISTGHIDSKFGISIHHIEQVLELQKKYDLNIKGLHMHTGSDILDVDVFLQGAEVLFNCASKFEKLKILDFGSGFKIKYSKTDKETNIEELGKTLSTRFTEFSKEYGEELEIWFEPGKFLVSEAGYFLVNVNTIKKTPSATFIGVNTGLNHFIRPMFYDAYHFVKNISNPEGQQHIYNVVGYICETDNLANNRAINEVRKDDVLCFYNAGAYCMSMASNYNSRPRPAEVLIHEGKDYLIRKAETFEDLIKNQIKVL